MADLAANSIISKLSSASENFFSAFEVNNRDFWPSDWIEINP